MRDLSQYTELVKDLTHLHHTSLSQYVLARKRFKGSSIIIQLLDKDIASYIVSLVLWGL